MTQKAYQSYADLMKYSENIQKRFEKEFRPLQSALRLIILKQQRLGSNYRQLLLFFVLLCRKLHAMIK